MENSILTAIKLLLITFGTTTFLSSSYAAHFCRDSIGMKMQKPKMGFAKRVIRIKAKVHNV